MVNTQQPIVTGTSVISMKYDNGVIIAADNLGSYGSLLRFNGVERLIPVGDNTVVGISGDISDMQHIERLLMKWQDADDERLEDITISSTIHPQNNSPQDQCVHVTTAGCENLADHDYIQVSSQDELSSTENVDLVAHCSSSSVGHENNREPSHEQSPDGDASQRRLQSLVSVVKRVKMYWSG